MGCGASQFKIDGHVDEGFEGITRQFEKMYQQGIDTESQLCVYVGDKKVVDIWGSVPNKGKEYTPDSCCNIWSSGKCLAAICMAIM